MISTLITFVVAALVGGLSTYFYTRSYWLTKLKTIRQALYDQYSRKRQETGDRTRLLETRERETLAQKSKFAEENRTRYYGYFAPTTGA